MNDFHARAREQFGGIADPARIDADTGEAVVLGLRAELLNLCGGGVGLEQRVINQTGQFTVVTHVRLPLLNNLNLVAVRNRPTATMVMSREDMGRERADMSEQTITIPTGQSKIHAGDTLIVVGKDADIDRFVRDYE